MARVKYRDDFVEIDGHVRIEGTIFGPREYHVYVLEQDETWVQLKKNEDNVLVHDTEHPMHNKRWHQKGVFAKWEDAEVLAATFI